VHPPAHCPGTRVDQSVTVSRPVRVPGEVKIAVDDGLTLARNDDPDVVAYRTV
jgi:hypothetical protein